MDRQTKNLLVSLGIALSILVIFRPKKNKEVEIIETKENEKYKEPKILNDDKKKMQDDSIVGLKAVRDAINNKESVKQLDELKNIILKENGIKIMINKSTNKLVAMSNDDKIIAEED